MSPRYITLVEPKKENYEKYFLALRNFTGLNRTIVVITNRQHLARNRFQISIDRGNILESLKIFLAK